MPGRGHLAWPGAMGVIFADLPSSIKIILFVCLPFWGMASAGQVCGGKIYCI
jgi:hypothetical protein